MAAKRNIVINANSVMAVLRNHEAVSERNAKQATSDPVEQARLVAGISNALVEIVDQEQDSDVLSAPTSAIAAQLQTFLAEHAVAENKPAARVLPGGAEEAKFDSDDWLGWAGSFFTWVSGLQPASWLKASTTTDLMPADARIALLGDWGTGLYGAPACAKCISATVPRFTHVIHLGDVYYSGTLSEIDERFIALWPSITGTQSRACNSNHEMYSGGHAYFNRTLALFGQKASYFAYENEHWLLVGLDTAYEEHAINNEQAGWLTLLLQEPSRTQKKLVLLTHHQPFALLETQGPKIISPLRMLLNAGRIHAWYWGHEHRCVIYDRHPVWKVAGRCIGHGGYPYFRDSDRLKALGGQSEGGVNGSTWYRMDGASLSAAASGVPGGLQIPGSLVLDGPNPYLEDEANKYGPHGYIALEFEGDRLFETYYVPTEPGPTPVAIITRREL